MVIPYKPPGPFKESGYESYSWGTGVVREVALGALEAGREVALGALEAGRE